MWNSPRVTTANWSGAGDTLKIVTIITFERDGQTSVMDLDEEWSLIENGAVLSVKHSSASDWGERNITMVYTRVEKKEEKQ
jgi:hypothetical protein